MVSERYVVFEQRSPSALGLLCTCEDAVDRLEHYRPNITSCITAVYGIRREAINI